MQKTITSPGWRFDNSYARLPGELFTRLNPVPVRQPAWVVLNRALAVEMGLHPDHLEAEIFAGNKLPEGAEPIAQAYAGHQFGHFTRLGDGRAILLGEHLTPAGARLDIQLKGSGQTPYSRQGDGRAALGPMLREHIVSEAMHALGIPTTRSLAVVATGEPVYRETVLDGAVLARVASSHIRVGTFEHAAYLCPPETLQTLLEHTCNRHAPEALHAEIPALALLETVLVRQARLISEWMRVGFVHGVMNTDNMALSGETIDYGPCAFMDAYHPDTVFSSIDKHGRYAYGNQPRIAHWNLCRLAETLLSLVDSNQEKAIERVEEVLMRFPSVFEGNWTRAMRGKLGLFTEREEDVDLIRDLLEWMRDTKADHTNTFANLTPDHSPADDPRMADWHRRWKKRVALEARDPAEVARHMRKHNPRVIPRNHKVEEALQSAMQHRNFSVMEKLLEVLRDPYGDKSPAPEYTTPPAADAPGYVTFCGT